MDRATLERISTQLYNCLTNVPEGESFDTTEGAGDGNGLEAWRRPAAVRPAQPQQSSRTFTRDPEPFKSKGRRLTRSHREAGRSYATLLLPQRLEWTGRSADGGYPEDLEKHLQLNCARLPTYASMRQEIVLYLEASRKSARQSRSSPNFSSQTNS